MSRLWRGLVTGFFVFAACLSAHAQTSNLQYLETLLIECLEPVADSSLTVRLDSDPAYAHLRPAVVSFWLSKHKTILDATAVDEDSLPTILYRVESTGVEYSRNGRRTVLRTVSLTTRISLTDENGRILTEDRCTRQTTDTLPIIELDKVENAEFAETLGTRPAASGFRRLIQPGLLVAALATTVYLFFTVRSQANNPE